MLSSQEKAQLRALIQSPQYKTLERLASLLIDKIQNNVPIRENEYETMKTLFMQEGQKEGIKKLLQEIFLNASE